ncbi:MAG: amidohydrolase family protein, partial [archaeon]|nr:amidohydrolase family protein [archaeon]
MSNDVSSSKWVSRLVILIFLSLLAWVTYGNLNNVIGMLSYYIVGILAIFPWCIPMGIGIIWGFVDIILFGGNWYNTTLAIAIVPPSWMTVLYYWIISLIGIAINLVVTMYIIQRIRSKPPKPKTNLALVNCNIIDGNKDSKVIKDGVILIKMIVEEGETPGIIEAVGKADEVEIPAGYEKIYLNGQWVLPGLINSHCHLMMNGKPMKAMAVTSLPDEYLQKLFTLIKIPLLRLLLYKMMHKNALTALNAGVTTLRSMGEMPYLGVKLRKSINKGKLLGPRILAAGLGISPTGGHGGFSGIVADSSVEIRKIV